jgi:hypothetical protein
MKFSARSRFIFSLLAITAVMGLALYMVPGKRAGLLSMAAHLRHQSKTAPAQSAFSSSDADKRAATESWARLPMQFEANEGQADSRVKFLSRGAGYSLFLTKNEAVLSLRKSAGVAKPATSLGSYAAKSHPGAQAPRSADRAVIRLSLEGANPDPQIAGQTPLPGHVNYFIGNDSSKWLTDIPTYSRVAYQGVYPGIDEAFYGNQRQLEYDFMVAPGADASRISMRVDGAERISLQPDGSVKLAAADGAMQLRAPVVYQGSGAGRKLIAANYDLARGNEIRFRIGAYDHGLPLVIDPMLVYSTFFGGSGEDAILAAKIDASGNFYVTGFTFSDDLTLVNPVQSTNNEFANGNQIAFISELSAAGNNLVFSTYLGGSGLIFTGGTGDFAQGIALDPSNEDVFVAGGTYSVDFPTTANAYQGLNGGGAVGAPTAFLSVLNAAGNGLLYSTYLGGNNGDTAYAVAADSAGNAYIGGATASVNFPIVPGAPEPTYVSSSTLFEGFLSKINTTLSGSASLTYSTFIGGTGNGNGEGDEVFGVRTDGNGNAFFGGLTGSSDFLTTAGITSAFQLNCAPCGAANSGFNGFAGEANTNVGAVGFTWLTYLGGSTADAIEHVADDGAGNLFVTGFAFSSDFPVTAGAFQTTLQNTSGGTSAFVTEFNAGGSTLAYSTYLGGSNPNGGSGDVAFGIALDSSDDAYVTGQTTSTNFPLANPIQSTNLAPGNGATDAFITELNPTGTGLVFSTYLGGSSNSNSVNNGDTGWGIEVDSENAIYVAGTTGSPDFPLAAPLQPGFGGVDDGFLTKISQLSGTVSVSPSPIVIYSAGVGTGATSLPSTLTNGTSSSITLSSVTITGTNMADFMLASGNTCTTGALVGASGGTCMIVVNYTPTSANTETAELTIVFNSPSSPIVVPLMGSVGSFTTSANPGSLTFAAGESGTSVLTVTPGTQGFAGTVTLACTGAPAAATCTVSPGSLTFTGGTTPETAKIIVNTTARSLMAPPPSNSSRPHPWLPAGTLALAALLGIGFLCTRRLLAFGHARYARVSVLALIVLLGLVGGMTACNSGGGGSGGGTPAGTYSLTVTATAGNLAPTTTLTLNVQ